MTKPLTWFVIALVIRLAYLSEQSSTVLFAVQQLDELENADAARALLAGNGFGGEPFFKAPLYSIFTAGVMALSGETWIYVQRLIQHFLGALLVVFAFDSASRLFGEHAKRRFAGAIAAMFVALHAPLVRLEDRLILDFMTVFLQSAMLSALIRMITSSQRKSWWALTAGAFAALAWLTRPTITPLIPVIGIWMMIPGIRIARKRTGMRRMKCRAVLLIGFIIFPAFAMLAIYQYNTAQGEPMLLPWQGGYNFYHANARGANGRYMMQQQWVTEPGGNPTKRIIVDTYLNALRRGEAMRREETGVHRSANAYWFDRGKSEIRADIPAWLGLCARKALYMVSDREIFNFEDYTLQRKLSAVLRILPGRFGLVWPFALASLAFAGMISHARRRLYYAIWGYSILLAALIALYYTSGRMRMPLLFPAIILASTGLTLLHFNRRSRRVLLFFLLMAIGLPMSWGDWWGVRSEDLRHMEYMRLSSAAFTLGRYEEALGHAEAAGNEQPDLPQLPQLKGQALYGLGRTTEALEQFQLSMRLLPNDPVAPYNIGVLFESEPDRALPYFEEALRRDPAYENAASAIARIKTGSDN